MAGGDRRMLRVSRFVGIAWLMAVVAICLTPSSGEAPKGIWGGWLPDHEGLATAILNIALYLPWGGVIAVRTGSVRSGLLGGFVLSVVIEAVQLWIPGRHTSAVDVTANSLGAWIGALLIVHRDLWIAPIGGSTRVLALAWLGIAGTMLASAGPILNPGAPNTTLYSAWTPRIGSLEQYDGKVLAARIGDILLPEGGPIAPLLQASVRSHLQQPAAVEVTFIAGSAPAALAPILRVAGPVGDEGLLVGVDGRDIVVRRRYIADDLKMARPDLRLRGVLSEAIPGDTVRLSLEREPGGVEVLTVNGQEGRIGFSPARGWSVFRYSSAWPDNFLVMLDFAWLTLLALPFGWWARGLPLFAIGSIALAGTLLVLPRFAGNYPGTVLQALAIVGIAATGYLLRTMMEGRSRGGVQTQPRGISESTGP